MDDDLDFGDDLDLLGDNAAFDDFGIDSILGDNSVETTETVSARAIRLHLKRRMLCVTQNKICGT